MQQRIDAFIIAAGFSIVLWYMTLIRTRPAEAETGFLIAIIGAIIAATSTVITHSVAGWIWCIPLLIHVISFLLVKLVTHWEE